MSDITDDNKQFVISAHVVRQLGEQLVSDEVTALIELVKNAYDADARGVSIIVNTTANYTDENLYELANEQPPVTGYIQIKDTGTGMDETDVTKGWLHISFSVKRGASQSGLVTPKHGRSFLGSKGVGRLSAQRLGNRLDLFSLKEYLVDEKENKWQKASEGVHVGINWNDFQENVRLQDVKVQFETWLPKNGRAGTKLVITDLQNAQAWQQLESRTALVSKLAQLISPFEPAKAFRIDLEIDNKPYDLFELTKGVRDTAVSSYNFAFTGDELILRGRIKSSLFRGGNTAQEALDYQMLIAADNGADFFEFLSETKSISGLKKGEGMWFLEYEIRLQAASLLSSVSNIVAEDGLESLHAFQTPGPFHGEIDQLAYENDEVDSSATIFTRLGEYKAYVRRQAGVRVYRDGFGIRPYGLDGNDWMGFQAGTTSGKSFYGLRPKNIIGYISLTAKENAILEEKTDREGFVLNPASRNFFTLVFRIRDEINNAVTRVRRRYNDYKSTRSVKSGQISSPAVVFSNLRQAAQRVATLSQKAQSTNIKTVEASISQKLKSIRETPLLESANDSKLQQLLETAQVELGKARELLMLIEEMHDKVQHLEPEASYLESQLEKLKYQLDDYTQLAGVGMTAEALSHEIGNIVDFLLEEVTQIALFLKNQPNPDAEILLFTERVRSSMHALRRQTQHLDPTLNYLREKREVIDIKLFIEGLKTHYEVRVRFREGKIKVIIENEGIPFTVFCSRGKLTQILDNILINSEYWLKESVSQGLVSAPHVLIRLNSPYLEISDNGMGVDPGIVPHLFQPFVTTKPGDSGRGLGLFIVHQLLESMSCTIELNRFKRPFIFRLDLTGILHA
jgi:signal transduction histidine kinase